MKKGTFYIGGIMSLWQENVEKVKTTKALLSPFKASEEEIACFIREVDEKHSTGPGRITSI